MTWVWPERHEVEPAGLADEPRTASGSVTPGSSTTTRSVPWVVTTGSETPVVLTRRSTMSLMIAMSPRASASCPRPAAPGTRRAGRPTGRARAWSRSCARTRRRSRRRAAEAREEVDRQGEDPDEEDEDRTGSTHRGGMLHGTMVHRVEGDSDVTIGCVTGHREHRADPRAADPSRAVPTTVRPVGSDAVHGTMKNRYRRAGSSGLERRLDPRRERRPDARARRRSARPAPRARA